MSIKHIVFDVGNVIVRWDPHYIVSQAFPEHPNHLTLAHTLFKSETWLALNKGFITEAEAIENFATYVDYDLNALTAMIEIARHSLTPIEGTAELIRTLNEQQLGLYALTDNTHAFMKHLKSQYDIWPMFKGIVVSAEEGVLKPSEEIFNILLSRYALQAAEAVFIDDVEHNVRGAEALGFKTIQFKDIAQCKEELKKLKILI